MLSTNQALNSFVSSQGKPVFILRTGNQGVFAHFTPSLYQIRIVDQNGSEYCHDVGFSGTRLLECLISSRGNALSREDLTAYAWPERVVGQGSLNQQIYTLRQLLNDDKERNIIQTLPRRGYLIDSASVVGVDYLDTPNNVVLLDNTAHLLSDEPTITANNGVASSHIDWVEIPAASTDSAVKVRLRPFAQTFKNIFNVNNAFVIISLVAVIVFADWWRSDSLKARYATENVITPFGSQVTFITRDVVRNEGLKQKVLVMIAGFDAINKERQSYEVLLLNQHIGFNCVTSSGKANSVIIHNSQLSNPSLYDHVKHCYEH